MGIDNSGWNSSVLLCCPGPRYVVETSLLSWKDFVSNIFHLLSHIDPNNLSLMECLEDLWLVVLGHYLRMPILEGVFPVLLIQGDYLFLHFSDEHSGSLC